MKTKLTLLLATLGLAAGTASCLIGTRSRTENTGNYVSQQTLERIQPGKDKAYVLALLGEPTTRTVVDANTEIWKWCYTEQRNSSGHLIFVLSADNTTETRRTTFVEFHGSSVVKAWTD
jgi:outer membrane protein assembly factor BamE (lipoprotein component of BamABCDE complex)